MNVCPTCDAGGATPLLSCAPPSSLSCLSKPAGATVGHVRGPVVRPQDGAETRPREKTPRRGGCSPQPHKPALRTPSAAYPSLLTCKGETARRASSSATQMPY